ncbi:MAG TPA: diguanylate cyclase, partial [Candidatus Omnitrophica bacterium]|nr:diguanylate cyclase [Candidatus Omnitrophota bacterium]
MYFIELKEDVKIMDERKVLIIDGEFYVSEKIKTLLEEQGCQVDIARGGLAGINAIYRQRPVIVFVDSSIKDIPNYQVCKLLKNNTEYKDLPIAIVGDAKKEGLNIFSIRDIGVDYIDISEDLDRINQHLKHIIDKHKEDFVLSERFRCIDDLNRIIYDISCHYNHIKRLDAKELNSLFEHMIEKITSILDTEIGSLMLVNEESQHLYIKAAKGLEEDIKSKTTVKIDEGISGYIINKEKPILVSDIEKDLRFSRTNNNRYYTKSFLSASLNFGKIRGVINVNNKSNKKPFNETDLTLMGLLINNLHFTLRNTDLFNKLEKKNKQVERLNSDRDIFAEINKLLDRELNEAKIACQVNKILSSDLDYKQTINAVIELIESSVDYHFCGLLILDTIQEAELIVSIKYPASEYDLASFKSKVVDTYYQLLGYNILLERILLNRTGPATLVKERNENNVLNSFYALPLNIKEKNLGLLALSHSRQDAFNPDEKKLISIIAEQSVIAINNAVLHKKIKSLSITDGLSGLYCYRFFQERLDDELVRARRYQEPLGLIMMDIDGFKQVNDAWGHQTGDRVLKQIAKILKEMCREVDIISRYGGEEFAVILPETNIEGTFYLAERIRKAIKNFEFTSLSSDETIKLTVSCGVASFPDSAKDKEKLIKKADDALYKAKNEGKDKT